MIGKPQHASRELACYDARRLSIGYSSIFPPLRASTLAFGFLAVFGCSEDPPTQIIVQAEGNAVLEVVEFEVSQPETGRVYRTTCGGRFPFSFAINRSANSTARSARVRALGKAKTGEVLVQATAEARFATGRALLLSMDFAQECVQRPEPLKCAIGESCVRGACESIYRTVLPEMKPERVPGITGQCSPFVEVGRDGVLDFDDPLGGAGGQSGTGGGPFTSAGQGGSENHAGMGGTAGYADGGSNGKAGAGGCPANACCIFGAEYVAGQNKTDNRCQQCNPAKDVANFSSLADGSECGEGCECRSGRELEVRCDDEADNDRDTQLNCADPDCAGRICQDRIVVNVAPTKDFERECCLLSGNGTSHTDIDGADEINLRTGPTNMRRGFLEFKTIPVVSDALTVHGATLWIQSPGGISVTDAAEQQLQYLRSVGDRHAYDATSLVRNWVSNTESTRTIIVRFSGNVNQSSKMGTLESITNAPRLELTYDARCHAGTCPKP